MSEYLTDAQIREQIGKYSFYHQMKLTDTITTPGQPAVLPSVRNTMRSLDSIDFQDKRVLDVGCRDGLFAFEAEKRGAREVIGIDNDLSPAAVEFLIPFFRSRVRMAEMNLFALTPDTFGKFDVVLCPGVLYHLRYPVWGLKRLQEVLHDGGTLLVETALIVDENRHALLYCPVGTESPYEPSSCTFYNIKGMVDTLQSLGLAVQKIYHQYDEHWDWWAPQPPPGPGDRLREPPPPGFFERLRAVFSPPPPKRQEMFITRSCFLCQFRRELIDTHLTMYWDGTHQFHRNSPKAQGPTAA